MYTFVDPLDRAQRLFANDVAMVSGGVRLTYAETWSRCRRLAGALTRLGVQPGDRVAILALNSHRYLEVYLAVPASGRVVVPLNTRNRGSYLPGPQLRYGVLSVIAGDNAMMAPGFNVVLAQPSRRSPMPGANESSTVEWQSAHVMPTFSRVSFGPKVPITPTTALSFNNCTVTAGSLRSMRRVRSA